jgi:hypothetical protein
MDARICPEMAASTGSITRCWLVALSLLVAACSDPQGSAIRSIAREGDDLVLDLDLRFTETQLQALDHGIPLRLAVQLGSGAPDAFIELRYSPLPRQYELMLPTGGARVFASRARLLAALERVVIADVAGTHGSARVELVSSALPAPLRLPALIDRDWQLATPAQAWGT